MQHPKVKKKETDIKSRGQIWAELVVEKCPNHSYMYEDQTLMHAQTEKEIQWV
jgi:hypothetical protein